MSEQDELEKVRATLTSWEENGRRHRIALQEWETQRAIDLARGLVRASRDIDRMIDVHGAKRLLLLWVPKTLRRWKMLPRGICLGRLWVQVTPLTKEEVERRYKERSKDVSAGEY